MPKDDYIKAIGRAESLNCSLDQLAERELTRLLPELMALVVRRKLLESTYRGDFIGGWNAT